VRRMHVQVAAIQRFPVSNGCAVKDASSSRELKRISAW
jgi:hypothetical protein